MGIGKSWLVRHALAGLGEDHRILTMRCHDGLAAPYGPLLDSVIPALIDFGQGNPSLARHVEVLQRLTHGVEVAGESDSDSADSAEAVKAEIVRCLGALALAAAADRPLLLSIDDLQWADDATSTAIAYLVGRMADTALSNDVPVAIVATVRTENPQLWKDQELSPGYHRICREQITSRLELDGLSNGDVQELLQHFGIDEREVAEEVGEITDGNPLFVTSIARQYRSGVGYQIPAEMQQVVDAQMAELGVDARVGLGAAAILIEPVSVERLTRLVDSSSQLEQHLDQAAALGLIERGDQDFSFTHPLFRRACADRLEPTEAALLHMAAADELEVQGASASEIVHHLVGAGERADGARLRAVAIEAGDEAYRLSAWQDAARHFEAAIDADPRCPQQLTPDELGQLCWRAGRARRYMGETGRSIPLLERAEICFKQSGNQTAATQVMADAVHWIWAGGTATYGELTDTSELQARITRMAHSSPGEAAGAMASVAQALWVGGKVMESRETGQQAIELARTAGDQNAFAHAALGVAITYWIVLDLHAATALLEETISGIQDELWPSSRIAPVNRLAMSKAWSGEMAEAESLAEHALSEARAANYHNEDGLASMTLMLVAGMRGDVDTADQLFDDVLWHERHQGYHWAGPLAVPLASVIRAGHGYWSDALASAADWRARSTNDGRSTAVPELLEIWICGLRDGAESISDRVDRIDLTAINLGRSIGSLTTVSVLVDLAWLTQRRPLVEGVDEAIDALMKAGAIVTTVGTLLDRLRAQIALLERRPDDALDYAESAVALGTEIGADREIALSEAVLTEALAMLGEPERAIETARNETKARGEGLGLIGLRRLLGGEVAADDVWVEVTRIVVFTDIVASTALTEELGDREFRMRSRRLERDVTQAVRRFGGSMIDGITLGDGHLATFGTVAGALDCAAEIHLIATRSELQVRVGLHAGDVIIDNDNVYGATVNRAARVCDRAEAGQTFVSDAVRSMAPTQLQPGFVSAGLHSLKGVPEPISLFQFEPPSVS